jgi:2-keto-4-pentenoate hydratase/2-oxohepta-3-ene-1,7-dioic acid hydratase in catechol pathway
MAGRPCAAIYAAEAYWPLMRTGYAGPNGATTMGLLEHWDESFDALTLHARACAAGTVPCEQSISPTHATILSPLRYPGKIIGVAFNYGSQLREMGLPVKPFEPLPFFVRPATNTLVGPSEPVHMPQGNGLDWEIEIGAVIGRRMRHVSAAEGLRGVAAYAVTVDMTVRDLAGVETAFKSDLFRGKCQDALSPIGPMLTPAAFVRDPHNLRLQLSVNGEPKQDERSSDMLVSIGELISDASRYITWEPGDLLLTGTPAGTSGRSGQFLRSGDRVHAQIETLGNVEFSILPRLG